MEKHDWHGLSDYTDRGLKGLAQRRYEEWRDRHFEKTLGKDSECRGMTR